jgi:uncharacterized RDD family membrane protein YckC
MAAMAYPRLIKRVRAVLIDSVVVPLAAVASVAVGYAFGITGIWERVLLFVIPVLLLEPGLVAWTRGTVGHHVVGLQVTRTDGTTKLDFFTATVRAAVKFVLGWFSLIFVLTTEKHQAIHDLLARSIVTYRDASDQPGYDVLAERRIEAAEFVYPSRMRRTLLVILYWIPLTLLIFVAAGLALSGACALRNVCSTAEALLSIATDVIWIVATGALLVLGWNGRLPGARRRPAKVVTAAS